MREQAEKKQLEFDRLSQVAVTYNSRDALREKLLKNLENAQKIFVLQQQVEMLQEALVDARLTINATKLECQAGRSEDSVAHDVLQFLCSFYPDMVMSAASALTSTVGSHP
jgi:hypothetical protein